MKIRLQISSAASKPVGMLYVKVVRASNLKNKDLMGKADPYVKLNLGGANSFAKVTRTMKSNLNPEWNESFKLIVNDPQTQSLEVHLYDWDKVSHSLRVLLQQLNPCHLGVNRSVSIVDICTGSFALKYSYGGEFSLSTMRLNCL